MADRDPRPVWLTDSSPRTLRIAGAPGSEVRLEVDQTFGELDHRWVQGPYTVGRDGAVEVEVEPPESAFVHPRCAVYVSDLRVRVVQGARRQTAPEAYLAWPEGRDGEAVVWTGPQARELAPNGVLDPALREGLADLDPFVRLMPDTSDTEPSEPHVDVIGDSGGEGA